MTLLALTEQISPQSYNVTTDINTSWNLIRWFFDCYAYVKGLLCDSPLSSPFIQKFTPTAHVYPPPTKKRRYPHPPPQPLIKKVQIKRVKKELKNSHISKLNRVSHFSSVFLTNIFISSFFYHFSALLFHTCWCFSCSRNQVWCYFSST